MQVHLMLSFQTIIGKVSQSVPIENECAVQVHVDFNTIVSLH